MIKEIFEHIKRRFEHDSDQPESPASDTSSLTQLTTEKIKALIADLNNAQPIFTEAGFIMEQLDIEIGLIPKLTPHFRQLKEISKQEEDQLLNQLNDRRLIKFILISLFKSSRMKSLLENADMYFHGIEIDITATPSVRTVFKREHSVAETYDITKH
ncbi:hypothetical protein [Aliikangiella coralliicola]|uniref:Uncharacterized protein n=1 Tax=Aliikangiella coralliicola TaxID=2592383 RepID=A0A545UA82_9GAMM|nr:hypothetical protein [Aliikangiella coralliicola]TQV86384.1 hypothetical protein FLL46_15805 [Aliikangiella coralliicola]